MPWHDWVILTCGVSGVVLAQIPATQKYACFAGLAGQIGWFAAVDPHSQLGIWLTCIVYALAWAYGLWLHWLMPWLERVASMLTASPLAGPASRKERADASSKTKAPHLKIVRSKD